MKKMLLTLLVPAAAWGQEAPPEDPRFGVMTHFAQGWDPGWVARAAGGSIGAVRDELYWATVEPSPGRFAFPASYDRYMDALRQAGIRPLIVLDFANPNYDRGQTPYTDAGCAAYARYAVEVLRHYGPQVREVEIWNEYNGSFCTGPAARDRADAYLRMLRAAYAAIKRERPDVIVAGGATSGIPLPYWEKLLAGGALSCLDVLSVHPYRYAAAPEGLENDIAGLQDLVKKYNRGAPRPIWVTEIGWYTKASVAAGDLRIDDSVQAKFLVRAYALLLSADVARIYWYLLHDDQGLGMGLLRNDAARTPKAAYPAMATMIRQLRGARFVRREPAAPGLYSLVFARPSGENVRVLWSLQPVTVAARGATRVTDLRGRESPPSAPLRLTDSPLFVSGPLQGLPAAAGGEETVLAEAQRDFSSWQGNNGWTYGVFLGSTATFLPLPTLQVSDWTEAWGGPYPYISITARDQHPSAAGPTPVTAVRRWESNRDGTVDIRGRFQCGTQGDGVGVSVLVDGQPLFRTLLGGGGGRPIEKTFDLKQAVHPGTCIDFAVDPGPRANIDFDATSVSAAISLPSP